MNPVSTGKVTDRRRLRFATIDELLADVDTIVAADQRGSLRRTGNWTAGQAMGHLAAWVNFGYEGFPDRPPWIIRVLIRVMKKQKYLHHGMDAGIKIPGVPGGTRGTELLSTEEGAARLRTALKRLRSGPPTHESPAFGFLTQDECIAINLRHAELHLSFQHPA